MIKTTIWTRLDIMAKHMTPALLTFGLVIFNIIPFHLEGLGRIVPLLPIMAVYHWGIYRSELLPVYAVFAVGILQDILSGVPIGLNALTFVSVYWFVVSQHGFFLGKSFPIVWLGFGLISGIAMIVMWIIMALFFTTLIDAKAALFQYLTTLGFYPLIAWGFQRWQRTFLRLV